MDGHTVTISVEAVRKEKPECVGAKMEKQQLSHQGHTSKERRKQSGITLVQLIKIGVENGNNKVD